MAIVCRKQSFISFVSSSYNAVLTGSSQQQAPIVLLKDSVATENANADVVRSRDKKC